MPAFATFDLTAYLREHDPAARPTGVTSEWVRACPRCGGDAHLYINLDKRCAHCFRCGWSPGAIELVAELEQRPRAEVAARLTGGAAAVAGLPELRQLRERVLGLGARPDHVPVAGPPGIELPEGFVSLAERHDERAERALAPFRAYLASRRVSPGQVTEHRIGCVLIGRYAGRVVLPVHFGGRLVGYQARDVTGHAKVKYLSPAGTRLGEALFNLDRAARGARIVLCEGIISALCTGPDAVASFGKALKLAQVALLVRAGRPVVVLYDAAKAETGAADASDEAHDAAERLFRAGLPTYVARLEHGDPGDNPSPVVRRAVERAPAFSLLQRIGRIGRSASPRSRPESKERHQP